MQRIIIVPIATIVAGCVFALFKMYTQRGLSKKRPYLNTLAAFAFGVLLLAAIFLLLVEALFLACDRSNQCL